MRVDSRSGFVHRIYCGIATFFAREAHGSRNGQGLKEYVWVLYTTVLILHGSLAIDNNCIMLYFSNDLTIS
jgi:hypothetical protein